MILIHYFVLSQVVTTLYEQVCERIEEMVASQELKSREFAKTAIASMLTKRKRD